MAAWKALLLLMLVAMNPCSSTMVTDLPGGGHVEVETGSRGQVCMYITDDWGAVEATQCTSDPGTYTLTGRGGGQARVTVNEYGGVSIDTGYFREVQGGGPQSTGGSSRMFGLHQQQQQQRQQQKEPSEEEENSVRFGAYENPRPVLPSVNYAEVSPLRSPPANVARRLAYRRPLRRRRPTATPTVPPVRVPHIPNTMRPTFGPLILPQGPAVTEAGLGAVEIIASGPGQLTVFGDGFDTDNDGGSEVTGPSAPYPIPASLVARKKRNRLTAESSSEDGSPEAAAQTRPARGGASNAIRAADGSTVFNSRQPGHQLTSVHSNDGNSVLNSRQPGHQLTSVHSNDGNSVLNSQQGGTRLSSVQSADGSSVLTSQTAGGQRLGLVRSPDGSVVFSTFIDGRLVNVVRSSDGSSVVSTNIDGHQVTALTSPAGQRLIAGAGPGQNLDTFFNRVMQHLDSV